MLSANDKDLNQSGDSTVDNQNPGQGAVGGTGQEGEQQGAIEGAGGQQDALQPSGGEQGAVGQQEQGGEQQGAVGGTGQEGEPQGAIEGAGGQQDALQPSGGEQGAVGGTGQGGEQQGTTRARRRHRHRHGHEGQQVLATIEEGVEEEQQGGGEAHNIDEGPQPAGGDPRLPIGVVTCTLAGNLFLREGIRTAYEEDHERSTESGGPITLVLFALAGILYLLTLIFAWMMYREGSLGLEEGNRGDPGAPGGGGPGRLDDPSVDEAGQRQRDLS
ncbi:hypothetical protein NRI_0629 [Neorickettsia risticii str. Illinois]|uniref:Uncharacterized protein n=1 Tax=Neorickettsia risticii (strain Illinois) TaxID=434131 RepID=C6V5D8_NEORI|nr:hypothetical protein [Neorickettsia risticii]ACT69597.1 hypothetical protein NRI_0629 [Neorickettsia risticii str. Illinois]